jgi:hypothetical protein
MTVKFKFCLWKIQGKILEVREKSGKSQGISLWKMAENPDTALIPMSRAAISN